MCACGLLTHLYLNQLRAETNRLGRPGKSRMKLVAQWSAGHGRKCGDAFSADSCDDSDSE